MSFSFRGASGDAVAALTDEVTAATGAGSTSATVADDLFGVAASLRTEGALRRFLTDASVPTEGKTGLVGEVYGSQVDAATRSVLDSAVGRRWTLAGDLPRALEQLGVVAAVRSAGDDSGRLADELFAVGQVVKDTPSLRDALSDPGRTDQAKGALLDDLLSGRALPATITLAKQALSGSYRTVGAALADYQRTAAEVHGEGVATVRTARPLTDTELGRLGEVLRHQYRRQVHLNVVVDPELIGGVRVEIGDDVIDGTVASRLDDARRRLVG